MARRKDHTREELIRLAIDCGRNLVKVSGPNALTARNVARKMGYTPGTLYNIFENIEGLIVAINTTSLERISRQMTSIFAEESNSEHRIYRFCIMYLQFHSDEPELWQLLFATPINKDALNEAYHNAAYKTHDLFTDALLPISRSIKAARQDAKIIWSTLHGICLRQQSDSLKVSEANQIEELIDRFLTQFLEH